MVKKALKIILIIFVICIAGLVALLACVDTDTQEPTDEATADMTPQEIDMEMYRPIRSAGASYDKLIEMIGQLETGESTTSDVYDYCQQVSDWSSDWKDTIDSMTDESTQAYADAASEYVANVVLMARDLMEYIDEESYEALNSAKEGVQLMPACESNLTTARTEYLSSAGLTDEEIQQQFDLG